MNTLLLERDKESITEDNTYLISSKGNFYMALCIIPQYETTLAKDFIDWLEDTTVAVPLAGKGFFVEVPNKEIDFYLNITTEAAEYNIPLEEVSLEEFVNGLMKSEHKTAFDCQIQLRWFFKEYMSHKLS